VSDRGSESGSADATDAGLAPGEPVAGASDDALAGGEIGRYVLLRPLASGGMGIVYLAFDPELDRNVALKLVIPRRRARADEPDALVAEARALAKLSHPNVIQVYDVGRWGDRVYVALEYVAGSTLDDWLRRTPRTWREILGVLLDAGRGLSAAHRADICHLDVKPSNILIGDDGVVRVLDFGLARSVALPTSDGAPVGDVPHRVVGTVGYIAPELFLGQVPDARSDQFGFCVTAWEALCGVRPYPGRTRREYERALQDGGSPTAQVKIAPPAVLDVLRTGLALAPASRRTSLEELIGALQAAASPWTRGRTAIATTAAAALVVGTLAWRSGQPASACATLEDPLAQVWNDSRATLVGESFAATNLPYAATTWSATRRAMDERVAQWRRTHLDNCIATHTDAIRPIAAHDRSLACLTTRRGEIEALVELFALADTDVVETAAAAARALPSSVPCLDDAPEPDGDAADDRELSERLAGRLAGAWALSKASRVEAAHELAEAVAHEARRSGLMVIEARAQLLQGLTAARLGRVNEAIGLLELGVRTADAAGADDERITGLTDLVYVAGHLGTERELAHWYAKLAHALLDRVGGRSPDRMILLHNEAVVFSDEGRFEDSLTTYRAALEAWTRDGGEVDEAVAALFNNTGSVYLARGEYQAAAIWFGYAYALRAALAGPEHPDVADILVNQANVLLSLDQPEVALVHAQRALAILEGARGQGDPATRFALTNLAVVLLELGRLDEARLYSERALAVWRAIDAEHPSIGLVLTNIAEGEMLRGDPAAGLAGYRRAHEFLARSLPPEHPHRANALAGIGRAMLELGDAAGAVVLLRKAVDSLDHGDASAQLRAVPRFALARGLAVAGSEPALVLGLAREARRGYVESGPNGADDVAEIDEWVRAWSTRALR